MWPETGRYGEVQQESPWIAHRNQRFVKTNARDRLGGMSEKLRESLSALMDGEASAFEVRRVLDELQRDAQLREAWVRWQRVSATLQGGAELAGSDLADRVWAGLKNDPAPTTEQASRDRPPNWRRLTAWTAASAAAVAVVVATQFTTIGGGGEAAPQVATVPEMAARPVAAEPPRPPFGGPLQDARDVNAYVLQHMQHKAVNQPDVGAFTKLVTFEQDPQR